MANYGKQVNDLHNAALQALLAMDTYLMLARLQEYIAPEVEELVIPAQEVLRKLVSALSGGDVVKPIGVICKDAMDHLLRLRLRESARPSTLSRYNARLSKFQADLQNEEALPGKSAASGREDTKELVKEAQGYNDNYDCHPQLDD